VFEQLPETPTVHKSLFDMFKAGAIADGGGEFMFVVVSPLVVTVLSVSAIVQI